MKPAGAFLVSAAGNQDYAVGPLGNKSIRIVEWTQSLVSQRNSLISRAAREPCPKRLLSQMMTAFLATRSISLTTTFGFAPWCKVANSQTTSKLDSANVSASRVAHIIETY